MQLTANLGLKKPQTTDKIKLMPGQVADSFEIIDTEFGWRGVNVKSFRFSAKGDGVKDDADAIQAALDTRGVVCFPPGTYLIKKNLIIRKGNVLLGVRGQTFIKIANDFVKTGDQPTHRPVSEGAIYNEAALQYHSAWSWDYVEETADEFYINGISFIHNHEGAGTTNVPKTTIFLANVKKSLIENCDFYSVDGTHNDNQIDNVDYHCNCYKSKIKTSYFENLTYATYGVPILVRNNGNNFTDPKNITRDIVIDDCDFLKDGSDEFVGIFGDAGPVSDVWVTNCRARFLSTVTNVVACFSIYAGAITDPGSSPAEVKNVHVLGNTITADNFSDKILKIGSETYPLGKISNVEIANNKLIGASTVPGAIFASAVKGGNSKNIQFNNNEVINTGACVKAGIKGFEMANDNTVTGKFEASHYQCGVVGDGIVYDNTENSTILGTAFKDCENVTNAKGKNVMRGVELSVAGSYQLTACKFDLVDDAAAIGIHAHGATIIASLDHNFVNAPNASSAILQIDASSVSLTNTRRAGAGKFIKIYNATLKYAHGNQIDANGYDTMYPGRITDVSASGIEVALPVGHISIDTSLPVGKFGWRKKLAGQGPTTWEQV